MKIVSPPGGVAAGWDAADALAEGWTTTQAAALISEAKPFKLRKSSRGDANDATHPEGGGRRRTPQRDTLIGLTEGCELWHDAERIAYATYPVNSHHEHWPIRSREFRMWLSGQFYTQTGSVIGGQALEDGIRILEAQAVNDGPQYQPFIRVGRDCKKLILDLCDVRWRVVEMTADGWFVVGRTNAKMLRTSSMRPLSRRHDRRSARIPQCPQR